MSIHELERLIASLPEADRRLCDRFLRVRHESSDDPGPRRRITRVWNRWLGEATSFDEGRRRRG